MIRGPGSGKHRLEAPGRLQFAEKVPSAAGGTSPGP